MSVIKQQLTNIFERIGFYVRNNERDVWIYFRNEYKNEAQHAYEHWLSTGKIR